MAKQNFNKYCFLKIKLYGNFNAIRFSLFFQPLRSRNVTEKKYRSRKKVFFLPAFGLFFPLELFADVELVEVDDEVELLHNLELELEEDAAAAAAALAVM